MQWRETDVGRTSTGQTSSAPSAGTTVLVAGFIALALVALGHRVAAVVVVFVCLLVTQAAAVSPRVRHLLARGAHRFAEAVGRALTLVLLGLTQVLVFAPASAIGRLRGRDLGERGTDPRAGWLPHGENSQARVDRRTFVAEQRPDRPRRRRLGVVFAVIGGLLLADLAAGALLAELNVLPTVRQREIEGTEARNEAWINSPALRDEPWVEEYVTELFALEGGPNQEYVPFMMWGNEPFTSDYVNVEGPERRSYRPPGLDQATDPVRIAFYGGSTMFGHGQRDDHTIPSQFARLAQAENVVVEVHNFGVSGWGIWQEFFAFERALARGEHFDLAVFHGGFNDFRNQGGYTTLDPTHGGAAALQAMVDENYEAHSGDGSPLEDLDDLLSEYADASAGIRLYRRVTGREDTFDYIYEPSDASTAEKVAGALANHRRATRRIEDLGDQYGVPVVFFWQPQAAPWPPALLDGLPANTIDISGVFDGMDPTQIYIDEVHTNERGAGLVAAALWQHLEDEVTAAAGEG